MAQKERAQAVGQDAGDSLSVEDFITKSGGKSGETSQAGHKPTVAHGNENPPTAHSLEEAANSDNSLEGYAAMNVVDDDQSEIAKIAYRLYEERGGHHGQHEDDWYRAEQEYRNRK